MQKNIEFVLNNKKVNIKANPLKRLIDVLREDLGIKGVKEGCGEGECGACSTLINGKLINSCIVAIGTIEGANVVTIEGFKETKKCSVIEKAFADAGAVQCGFCTPGMVLAAEALLSTNSKPKDEEIRRAISGNLCRCTGYNMIVEAVKIASQRGDGLW